MGLRPRGVALNQELPLTAGQSRRLTSGGKAETTTADCFVSSVVKLNKKRKG